MDKLQIDKLLDNLVADGYGMLGREGGLADYIEHLEMENVEMSCEIDRLRWELMLPGDLDEY